MGIRRGPLCFAVIGSLLLALAGCGGGRRRPEKW